MRASLHNHSIWSDGKNTIAEIIDAAAQKNLTTVGISDHFLLAPHNVRVPGCMSVEQLDDYIDEVSRFKTSSTPKVLLGLEVDYFDKTEDLIRKELEKRPFDYLIGSVHVIKDVLIDASPKRLPLGIKSLSCLFENERKEVFLQYWQLIKKMAESKIFDIAGHLDLPKKYGFDPAFGFEEEIEEALLAIRDAEISVELNTSGWHYPCKEQYPSEAILKRCQTLKIPIIISADAHLVEHIDRDFDKARKLLLQAGVSESVSF